MKSIGLLMLSALPLASVADFQNAGFETPVITFNSFVQQPSNATWLFTGNSGIGSGATAWSLGGYASPQYAYLQSNGNAGRLSQVVTGLNVGAHYRVRFRMTRRASTTPTPIRVVLDGATVIRDYDTAYSEYWLEYGSNEFTATAASHEIRFEAFPTAANNTTVVDEVHLEENPAPLPNGLNNGSFESPALPPATYSYRPNTIDMAWTFSPSAGIANGNGSWGTGGQNGPQYAYIQNDGVISQTVQGLTPGVSYRLNFYMSRRNGSVGGNTPNPIRVLLDGNVLMPETNHIFPNWEPFSTPYFIATSTSHTLSFVGAPPGGDRTELIDNVVLENNAVEVPESYTVLRGSVLAGGVSEMGGPDDNYLFMRPGAVLVGTEFPAQIAVTGTSLFLQPAAITLLVESGASISNLEQKIDMWDFVSGAWVNVDTRALAVNDTQAQVTVNTNAPRYVDQATGQVRVRLRAKNLGAVILYPWSYRIDFVRWTFG